MEIFRFRRFEVRNERSAMKVNTDGVLLGALMTVLPGDRRLLDIGTGTGTIALMAAQRLSDAEESLRKIQIIGIDIDGASAEEAAQNFAGSPWVDWLCARHISLNDYDRECCKSDKSENPRCGQSVCKTDLGNAGEESGALNADAERNANSERDANPEGDAGSFDLIFSNPPYFESSLKAPDSRRRTARHAETMSYREIIAFAARHLRSGGPDPRQTIDDSESKLKATDKEPSLGRLAVIIPTESEREAIRYAASFGLALTRRVRIKTTPNRDPFRSILEFSLNFPSNDIIDEEITIMTSEKYTKEYRTLMKNFLFI